MISILVLQSPWSNLCASRTLFLMEVSFLRRGPQSSSILPKAEWPFGVAFKGNPQIGQISRTSKNADGLLNKLQVPSKSEAI